jgi:phosphatidylglycerophosphate synthase
MKRDAADILEEALALPVEARATLARQLRHSLKPVSEPRRRHFIWLAHRLPHRVTSDHLTLLALAANWFGDSLDGTLARVRRHERPRYGSYVDHVLDIAGITLLIAGIAVSGYMTPVVALSLLAAYLLVAAEVFLATGVNGEFRMSFLKVGPTELRILLAVGTLALYRWPTVHIFGFGGVLLFDVRASVGSAGLAVAFVVAAARTTRALYHAEPLPGAGTRRAA